MDTLHPNLSLLERFAPLIPNDLPKAKELFADDFVWHYFNPELPELAGDYSGFKGLQTFFQKLGTLTNNTFDVQDKQVMSVGDELVITCAKPSMTLDGESFETDAVVIWRIVDNQVTEAWDIPAVHTIRPQSQN